VDVPTGASRDQWIDGYFDAQFSADPRPPDSGVACPRPRRTTVATEVVDGHPVDFYSGPGGPCGVTYAFVQVGNRLYAFVLWKGGSSEWDLEAFLSTVRFR
jgi:hypothetical protein